MRCPFLQSGMSVFAIGSCPFLQSGHVRFCYRMELDSL